LDIQKAADEVVAGHAAKESLRLAKQLFTSEIYQARSLATFILGQLAANSNESLEFLKRRVSQDKDWRVQEILAKALTGIVPTVVANMHSLLSRNGWQIPSPMCDGRSQKSREYEQDAFTFMTIQKLPFSC
jgi:HEAT repeat protein